jgi:hypothetical protein
VKRKAIAFFAAIVVATASIAQAGGLLSIPPLLPDLCFPSCLTFTNTTALAGIQNIIAQAQSLDNQLTNLLKMPGMSPSGIQQYIGQVTQAGQAVNQLTVGNATAARVIAQAQAQAQAAAKANADAQAAKGNQQAADATNEQLGNLNATEQAHLDLDANLAKQAAANEQYEINLFTPNANSTVNPEIM